MKGDDSSPGQRMALVLVPEDFRLGKCILGWTLKNMPNLVGLQNGSDSGERATLVGVFSEKEKRRSCFGGATNCGSFTMAPTSPKMPFRKSSTKQGLNCGSSKTVPTPPKKPPCFRGNTTAPAPPKKLSRSPTIQGLNCGSSKTAPAPPKKPHRFGEATNCGSSKTAPTPSKKPLRRSPTKQDLNRGSSKIVPAPPKKPPRFEGATNYDSSKTTLVPPKKPLRRNPTKQGLKLVIVRVHGRKEVIKEKKKKLRAKYAAMCDKRKVECDVLFIEDDDVAKALREHIELKDITNLVVGVEAELYSEKTKSLNSEKAIRLMETEAPLCNIWFICNGQLIFTRAVKDCPVLIPDGFALNIQLLERNIEKCRDELQKVILKKSNLKNKLSKLKEQHWNGSSKRNKERKKEQKSYELESKDADKEELRLRKLIGEMESSIQVFKRVGTIMHILHERETARNSRQTTMASPAETMSTDFYDKREIEESMLCFDNTLIGKRGRSGSVYKGVFRTTVVAIKKLHRESMQGESEFLRKVALLSRVRHPNLATLMGACKEVFGLVFEFLPNGSLQDWLERRNEMQQLRWQVRTKIILDIRTVLIFLHSNKPQPVVHGNLKPSKVLLDYNFACKLEASGISQSNGGEAAMKRDVQSFGIIILQLLTKSLPQQDDVAKVVDKAMKEGKLDTVLDDTAGTWPPQLVNQLARCGVEMSRGECPDLLGNVWKVLDSLRTVEILTSGQDDAPDLYKCPISRDVMERPHVASDGYSYDYNKIMRVFMRRPNSSVTVKSPMTNLDLKNLNLIPELSLKSAIEQWKVDKPQQQMTQVRSLLCDPPVQISEGNPKIIPPEETESQPATHLLPPSSSSPPTTLISSTTDARSRSIIAPPNASDAAARSHRLSPLQANPSTAVPPPRPLSPFSTFLPPPTGIRPRHVNSGPSVIVDNRGRRGMTRREHQNPTEIQT